MMEKRKKTQIREKKGSQAAAQKRTAATDPKENEFIISTPNSERKCHFLFILIFLSDTLFGFTFSFRFPQPTDRPDLPCDFHKYFQFFILYGVRQTILWSLWNHL